MFVGWTAGRTTCWVNNCESSFFFLGGERLGGNPKGNPVISLYIFSFYFPPLSLSSGSFPRPAGREVAGSAEVAAAASSAGVRRGLVSPEAPSLPIGRRRTRDAPVPSSSATEPAFYLISIGFYELISVLFFSAKTLCLNVAKNSAVQLPQDVPGENWQIMEVECVSVRLNSSSTSSAFCSPWNLLLPDLDRFLRVDFRSFLFVYFSAQTLCLNVAKNSAVQFPQDVPGENWQIMEVECVSVRLNSSSTSSAFCSPWNLLLPDLDRFLRVDFRSFLFDFFLQRPCV